VVGTVTDDHTVASLQAQVDGAAPVSVPFDGGGHFQFTTALPLDGSADGGHTVLLTAKDAAGNATNSAVTFLLDTPPPSLPIAGPANGQSPTHTVTVPGRAVDGGSGLASLQEAVDAGAFAPVPVDASGNFSFTTALAVDGSTDGGHTVHLKAADAVGNVQTA